MIKRSDSVLPLLLLLLAFAVDLLTPFLIREGILPSAVRWLPDLAVAGMIVLAFANMLVFDHIPRGVLLIVGISLIGITVAFFEGQTIAATGWGWWLMFRYILVGILAYLQDYWPEQFAKRLINLCMIILGFEFVVQLGQFATGQIPGDDLAGTFGRGGTATLIIFILFLLCIALGQWLTNDKWHMLLWVLLIGGISSVLGAMKLFPFAAIALGGVALLIHMVQRRQLRKLPMYLILFIGIVLVFAVFYNEVVVQEIGGRRLEQYLELQTLDRYLNFRSYEGAGRYELGRGFALSLGWETIQRDTTTFLFGMGLGSRGESVSLGIAGEGLRQSYYGLTSGTSLLVLMQEMGVIGLVVLVGAILWIIVTLAKDIKMDPGSDITVLRYAIILFSIGWPLWLWYARAWNMGVPMLLYWVTLGYLLGKPHRELVKTSPIRATQNLSGSLFRQEAKL
jgi:hypothetical protein